MSNGNVTNTKPPMITSKDDLTKDIFKYIGGAVLGFVAGRGSIKNSSDK